ncbi:MAG: DUF3025 domain-containing protein [Pseudomonadota bacterium]|nr:DUF3025 domain-containing protein [Pseudomonadota bacterium]
MPSACATTVLPLPWPDWAAPWWQPWADAGHRALHAVGAGLSVHEALNTGSTAPVRFVPPQALPEGSAYESYIFQSGCVPTREGWHDFLNALVWQRLPAAKQRMNALQAADIARNGVQARRGPVRDAITVLDENGALLHAPDALWQALAARRWADLFGPLRPLWRQSALLVLGHAALEKLLAPYKSITVHVWRAALPFDPAGDLHALDAWLATDLTPEKLAAKPFKPLPVLGVPGWWPANEAPGFYSDAQVFRPLRAG